MFNYKRLSQTVALSFVLGLTIATPAHAADWFDYIAIVTNKLSILRTFLIWLFFIIGLGGVGWAVMEMFKVNDQSNRGDVTWKGILIKGVAGALLVAFTATTDTMRNTVFGGSSVSNSVNTSMLNDPTPRA